MSNTAKPVTSRFEYVNRLVMSRTTPNRLYAASAEVTSDHALADEISG